MKYALIAIFCMLAFLPCLSKAGLFSDDTPACVSSAGTSFSTVFSTSATVAPAVVQEIANARKSIRMITGRLSSKAVTQALVEAARAGRDVKVIVDKSKNSDGYSAVHFLETMGHPPHVLPDYDNVYMNFIVIDDKEIIGGNTSILADVDDEKKNPVGVLIIHNAPDLAKNYIAAFDKLWSGSVAMKQK